MKRHCAHITSGFAIVILTTFIVLSCGGGGGGSGSGGPKTWLPPYIYAELFSLPTGSSLPGYQSAVVYVLDDTTGTAIDDASVRFYVSGVTDGYAIYNSNGYYYEGDVPVAPGRDVTLRVTVYDNENMKWRTYVSHATQFSSYPTIIEPASGPSWSVGLPHTIVWSGSYPPTNTFIGLGIADLNNIDGDLLWPSDGYLLELASTETSYTIQANSMTPGSGLVIVALGTEFPIACEAPGEPSHNAAPGSTFVIGGFNYVPITLTGP